MSEPKQVIVIRKDLRMGKGKIASQASHASLKVVVDAMNEGKDVLSCRTEKYYKIRTVALYEDDPLHIWLERAFTKICVYVDSEEELLEIKTKADRAGIRTALITDSGLTEFHGVATNTCIAIGPDFPEKIDPITGHLKLL